MEKIKFATLDGKPIIGREEFEEAILRINEIIDWIHRQPKELWELSPEEIERIGRYIQKSDEIEWPRKKLIDERKNDGRKY